MSFLRRFLPSPPSLPCIQSGFVWCQQWLKANTINLKSEHAVQRLRGVPICLFLKKNRAVLGSVIMLLPYRLFRVHIFKCPVVKRWFLGVSVQKHLTSHSSCWQQLWSWRVTLAVLAGGSPGLSLAALGVGYVNLLLQHLSGDILGRWLIWCKTPHGIIHLNYHNCSNGLSPLSQSKLFVHYNSH